MKVPRGASALLAALAACSVDQAREVAEYRGVLEERVPMVAAYRAGERLDLARALALASQGNEQLALHGEDYVQALVLKARVAAAFWPTLAFAPSYAVVDRPTGSLAGSVAAYRASGSTARRFEAPVVADVNLFRGFGDLANLDVAEATIRQRREVLVDVQASVLVATARIYYRVLRAERAVAVLRSSVDVQTARLRDVEQQLANGLATRLAVAQTRAQADATRAALSAAEGDVAIARIALARILGVPAVDGPLAEEFAVPETRPGVDDYEAEAFRERQDLRAARDGVAAARAAVSAAAAQYYPSLSLNLAGFLTREHRADASLWTAFLGLNLPLFTGGRIHADVRDAWSRWRQVCLAELAVHRQVTADVRTAHTELLTAERRIVDLEDEVRAAREALAQARAAFANQLAVNLDVLTAQDRVQTAELELSGARFDRTVSFLDLLRATGRIDRVASATTSR